MTTRCGFSFALISTLALFAAALAFPGPAFSTVPDDLTAIEWQEIQAQIVAHREAARFEAVRDERDGSLVAANPLHGFAIRYAAGGATELELTPGASNSAAAHRIRLTPVALGYGDSLQALAAPRTRHGEGERVDTVWDDNLREWWVNNAGGLEQWFQLDAPPEGRGRGSLRVELALDSTLNAELAGAGADQHLLLHDGSTRVRFEKLLVEDASGQRLPARMQLEGNRLAYVIDDHDAVYPLTIDPTFVQQAYLKASNTDEGDQLGFSVAVSGDTVVVGAYAEDGAATGVDGDEGDNSASAAGAAYVFVRQSGAWSQQAYLKASNTGSNDRFGDSVAVSGDTVVVGAAGEDSAATGVDGDQEDNSAGGSGAAYVFVRNGSSWSQQAYLKASNTNLGDAFGRSVAVSGDTVVVGASDEESAATGVNGDQADNSASNAGATYVFVRNGSSWSQQAYLKASNSDVDDRFGDSVAVAGDTVVVGAYLEDSAATGVDGNEGDDSANAAGAAYVFVRNGSSWSQQAYLKASNSGSNDWFGESVAVSGDTVVVSAVLEDSAAAGMDGDQADNSASAAGAAYVFVRQSGAWSQQAYLKASNTNANDVFGRSVAVSGDTVVVGATSEDSAATGVDGDQGDNSATNSGAAYVFDLATFTVGGTVSGIEGDQVVLQNNGGDDQVVTANGAFTFPAQDDGTGYNITVTIQPDNPSQTCSVVNGSGTLMGADVTNVEVTCTTNQFTVGGTVSGLEGDQVVLQNNGGDDQVVTANGSFTFPAQDDLSGYDVTVLTQPTGPIQTCTVSDGQGNLAGGDVTDVQVACATEPPEVSLSAGTLDFGIVLDGDTSTASVTVTNTGTGELVISELIEPAAPFSVTGGSCTALPVTLLPDESCDLSIAFAPASITGGFVDEIVLISNAASSPDAIELTGGAQPLVIPALDRYGLLLLVLMFAVVGWRFGRTRTG